MNTSNVNSAATPTITGTTSLFLASFSPSLLSGFCADDIERRARHAG